MRHPGDRTVTAPGWAGGPLCAVPGPGAGRGAGPGAGAYGGCHERLTEPPNPADDDCDAYTGLGAEEAEERARQRGWTTVRTLPPDAIITMEYVVGRINFAVKDGTVVRSWKG